MAGSTLTKRDAAIAVSYLQRVVARGPDEERELLRVVDRLQKFAAPKR